MGNNVKNRLIDGEESIAVHYFWYETMPRSISQMISEKKKWYSCLGMLTQRKKFASLAATNGFYLKPGWNDNKYPILERLRNIGFDVAQSEVDTAMIHDVVLKILTNIASRSGVPRGLPQYESTWNTGLLTWLCDELPPFAKRCTI